MNPSMNHFGTIERPSDPILAMSPAEAKAALEKKHDAWLESQRPQVTESTAPAVRAHVELDRLESDPSFMKKVREGDSEATEKFSALNRIVADPDNKNALALAGITPRNYVDTGHGLSLRDSVAAVNDLRAKGHNDIQAREMLDGIDSRTGKPFDAETIRQAKYLRDVRNSDSERVRKFLSGSVADGIDSRVRSAIIGSEVSDL